MKLLLFLLALFSGIEGLIVANQFASPTGDLQCKTNEFLLAESILFDSDRICQPVLTSVYNYMFTSTGPKSIEIKVFDPNDPSCNGTVLHAQHESDNVCFHLFGDNPAAYWRLEDATTPCKTDCANNGTCCWLPQLPGHECSGEKNACCCPDFLTSCPSGSSCACSGECPGPNCQCEGCFKGEIGLCNNGYPKSSLEAYAEEPKEPVVVKKQRPSVTYLSTESPAPVGEGLVCEECVKFFARNLNLILNLLLEGGVEGSCNDLCSKLPGKDAPTVCDLLCVLVGLDGFIHILDSADLDPVYMCAHDFKICPKNQCTEGCTDIVGTHVTPSQGKLRTTFDISFTLRAHKKTGVGTTYVQAPCLSATCKEPAITFGIVNGGLEAGSTTKLSVKIHTDEDDWNYRDGTYPVSITNCAYDCGDEHASVLATSYTNFTIEGSRL